MPTCASQEFLSLSRQILASFCPRSCRPMCQRQANQVDMIMFRPGDPLNCSWCLPGVSLAGGWRAGGRGHVSPGNGVMFGWCSTVVLSDQRSQSCQAGRRAGGGGGGWACRRALSCFAWKWGKHRLAFALGLPSRWRQSWLSRQAG